jgi:hypothetical protein
MSDLALGLGLVSIDDSRYIHQQNTEVARSPRLPNSGKGLPRQPSIVSEDMADIPARKPRWRNRNRDRKMAAARGMIRNDMSDQPVRDSLFTDAHASSFDAN